MFGRREGCWKFIQSCYCLWLGVVRWSVRVYIFLSRRVEKKGGEAREGGSGKFSETTSGLTNMKIAMTMKESKNEYTIRITFQ